MHYCNGIVDTLPQFLLQGGLFALAVKTDKFYEFTRYSRTRYVKNVAISVIVFYYVNQLHCKQKKAYEKSSFTADGYKVESRKN